MGILESGNSEDLEYLGILESGNSEDLEHLRVLEILRTLLTFSNKVLNVLVLSSI